MSILILYNQSYIETPNFYALYGDDPIANYLKQQLYVGNAALSMWSSFPLAIQTHVASAMLL